MPRCKKKPSNQNERSEAVSSQTSVRNDNSALTLEHLRTHTHPCTTHPHPSTSAFKEPIAGPSGLAATRRHTLCYVPNHHRTPSSSSSRSDSVDLDSDSSSSDSDCYRDSCNRTAPTFNWLVRFLWRLIDFTVGLGRSLSSLCFSLPRDVLLLRGDYHPLRRTVAGLTLLGLGCWFCVPILYQQPSGSVNTASGLNLAQIQQQLMDIQEQLTEKEANWKETLLKEMGSLPFKVELSKWLQEHLFTGSNPDAEGVVLWPELQVVLENVEKRLVQSLATSQDVRKTVQEALSQYKADGTGMADYALIFSGGKVIKSHYIKPYCPKSLQLQTEGPSAVIQPEVYPGMCWAFRGSYGSVTIALSQSVKVTHVTMEHLPKSLSPTGRIDSAPQDFAIYGIDHADQHQEGVFLGKFAYNKDGDPIQTFALKVPVQDFYPVVELRILTNWGNPAYTCVYRFRVHGQPKNA
ncbi:SUN domain-containing protein 2-like [Sardina pilchardus]|uniref:SUN domain-containing protein 2-like n=1 Tax=Sardina pilchardus TaxID=27697 RepID=UPI002E0FBD21